MCGFRPTDAYSQMGQRFVMQRNNYVLEVQYSIYSFHQTDQFTTTTTTLSLSLSLSVHFNGHSPGETALFPKSTPGQAGSICLMSSKEETSGIAGVGFLWTVGPSCHPTNSVKALKEKGMRLIYSLIFQQVCVL